ncbi:peptidase s41, partial [Lasius niger]
RDWKGNTLKKAADNKAYATGGGSPKVKVLTSLEMELLDFLTPEASGFDDIAQGGFQYLTPEQSNIKTPIPLEDALNINIFARKMQKLSVSSTSFQAKSNCTEIEFSTSKVFDSLNDDDSDIEFSVLTTSKNKENIKNQETASRETEIIARKLKRKKTTNEEIHYSLTGKSPKTQFKGSETKTAETAVDLLRHKM